MDDYPSPCPPPYVLVYETATLREVTSVDTVSYWHGLVSGYALVLLTVIVIAYVLHRLRPQGGAHP